MKMTLKNQMLVKIEKLRLGAEKLDYVPDTIEVTKDELRTLVNELCQFKSDQYVLLYKDRRREGDGPDISSSMSSVFLQHRPNEVFDILVAKTATLSYHNGIKFVVVDDPPPEQKQEDKDV